MTEVWKAQGFLVADIWNEKPRRVAGYVYRGLGLQLLIKASPKGRRPPTWGLTHLGSGHTVCMITGHVATAFPIAFEIAQCGDWDFDGLNGWINRDPELPKKVRSILDKHLKVIKIGAGGSSDAAARAVAMARA